MGVTMERDLYEAIFNAEATYWWYTARRRVIFKILEHYLPPRAGASNRATICDLGTGCGYNLLALGGLYDVTGMDCSLEAIHFSAKRGIEVLKGRLPDDLPFTDESFDAVLLLDVLEHLEDDVASLSAAARLIRPGGLVLCTVPAYQWLWTRKDDYYHHRRRYTLRQVRGIVESAGLTLRMGSYYNMFLFPLAATVLLWRKAVQKPSAPSGPRALWHPVNRLLDSLLGIESLFLPHVRFPFGTGIVCVATRAASMP